MPLINFKCKDCNAKFSELVYNRNKDKVRCPKCNGEVEQIYEGRCNSFSGGSSENMSSGTACQSCPMRHMH